MRPGAPRSGLGHGRPARRPARGPGRARRREPGGRRGPGRRPAPARGHRGPVRPALERPLAHRHPHVVAAGRPGLGRLPGRLRRAPAHLPGRRLADPERRRPGPDRPHRRRLPYVPGGAPGRRGRHRPGPARPDQLQPALPQRPQLGPARPRGRLRHRRRPRRGAGPGRPVRRRRLLPAVPGRPDRGGAVPLSADRRGPGKSRICRTERGSRRRGHPAKAPPGRTPLRHHPAHHRARLDDQAPAPPADPGRRGRVPGRPARVQLDPPARPGRAHRPDPHRARLAGPARAVRRGRRAAHPGRPGRAARYGPVAGRPGHRRAGLAVHPQRVLLGLRAGRCGRPGRHRPGVLGRRAGTPPPARPVVAGGRGVRRLGARGDVPGQPVPLASAGPPGGLAVRGVRDAGPGHCAGRPARHPAARHPRAVRPGVPAHRGRAGPGRDDRIPAADGDAVRAVGDRGRPVLRHRQRGAGHLRRHGLVRRGLAGPGRAAALCPFGFPGRHPGRPPGARRWPRSRRWRCSPCSRPAGPGSAARWAGRSPWCRASPCC